MPGWLSVAVLAGEVWQVSALLKTEHECFLFARVIEIQRDILNEGLQVWKLQVHVEEVRNACLLVKLLGATSHLCHWMRVMGRMCCLDWIDQRFMALAMLSLNNLTLVSV